MLWSIDSVKTGYPLTSITWPYRGLRCWPIEVKSFFEVILWQVTSFQMIAGSSLIFFSFIWNMFCFWAAQLKFWFKTDLGPENSASYLQAGKTVAFDFAHHGHALVTLYVHFLCSDWSNLTGELMRKIYAAPWILFTRTAEADRVLCQLVMFFTFFFHWMYKMKFSCYQEQIRSLLLFMDSLFIGFFGWEIRRLSKSEIKFRMASFLFSPCLMRKRVAKSEAILTLLDTFQELHLEW